MPNNWKELLILKHIYQEATPQERAEFFYWLQRDEKLVKEYFCWFHLQQELDQLELSPREEVVEKILQQSLRIEPLETVPNK